MTTELIVVLRTGEADGLVAYGPFDEETAHEFAGYLAAEVDPAYVVPLRSPTSELLGYWRSQRAEAAATNAAEPTAASRPPKKWPPYPGDVYQDRNGDRWVCTRTTTGTPYLVCLAKQADDTADEVWHRSGPLTHCGHVAPNEEEPPF